MWTRSSAVPPPPGCSARSARDAGVRYSVSVRTRSSTSIAAPSPCTSAPAGTGEACEIIGRELESLRRDGATEAELERAKEGRQGPDLVLALESTFARMARNARSALFGLPLLSIDELIERTDAVTSTTSTSSPTSCTPRSACRPPASVPTRTALPCRRRAWSAKRWLHKLATCPSRSSRRRRCRRAHGCHRLRRRRGGRGPRAQRSRRPGAGYPELADVLDAADVVVDFTIPDTALGNAISCLEAGVSVVVGTTGFDLGALREAAERSWSGGEGPRAFVAPNFAIGAVLMMQIGRAVAAHAGGRDRRAPPRPQARQAVRDLRPHRRAAPRRRSQRAEPIHSIRLPGLVAQGARLRRRGQTLTIRHDSIDRSSFMPGVVLACRRVGTLPQPLTVGLEALL